MSQFYVQAGGGPTDNGIRFLTGNSGGQVTYDPSFNVNILGGTGITVVGTPGTNTLTISSTGVSSINVTSTSTNSIFYPTFINNFTTGSYSLDVSSSFEFNPFLGDFTAQGTIIGGIAVESGAFLVVGMTTATIQLPNAASTNYNFNLPNDAGTSGYFLTSAGGGSSQMTWTAPTIGVISWTDQSGAFAAAVNRAYFITAISTATLPSSPAQGNTIIFTVDTASVLTIQANTGQTIRLGNAVSSAAGTTFSTAQGDSITLVYRSSDTSWIATASIGNWNRT